MLISCNRKELIEKERGVTTSDPFFCPGFVQPWTRLRRNIQIAHLINQSGGNNQRSLRLAATFLQ